MPSEFTFAIIGDQALVINQDGDDKTGYLVHDLTTVRSLVDKHLEKNDDRTSIMERALASRIPERNARSTVVFSQASLRIWQFLLARTCQALELQDPLPDVPNGKVCIAMGDGEGCMVFGSCDPHGKHQILIFESTTSFKRALHKELNWLVGTERDFYIAMLEQAFTSTDELVDPEYVVVEGDFCHYLNVGSSWLDDFESQQEEREAEDNVAGYFSFPVTPEG